MRILLGLAATVSIASLLTAQIPLPPHSSVYNGYSRGFNFTSSIAFNIVGLDLPLDAFQPGDTACYAVQINGVPVLTSIGNAGAISTGIVVLPGDVVDIIGNWSPAVPGTFTAHNSYGNSAPYATTIEGVAHTLNRIGVQNDIGNPAWVPGTSYLAPTSGPIGRVEVYTSTAGGTVATNTTQGVGCGSNQIGDATFYELFDASNTVDIASTGFTMVWSGDGYVVLPGATPIVPPVGGVFAMTDDQTLPVALPFPFPCTQGLVNTVYLCSNGWLSMQPTTDVDLSEAVADLLSGANRLAFLWDDLNPSAGGQVTTEIDGAGVFQITFTNVPEYSTTNQNTVQVSLAPNGDIEVKYGALALADALVGFSTGGGASDPGGIDLTAIAPIVLTTGFGPFFNGLGLSGVTRPVLGTNWDVRVDDIPGGSLFGLSIYGVTNPNIPDLAVVGMPGCGLFANLDIVAGPWVPAGSTYTYTLAIPAVPTSLIGFEVFTQAALATVPAPNPFGWITSNGIKGTLGDI